MPLTGASKYFQDAGSSPLNIGVTSKPRVYPNSCQRTSMFISALICGLPGQKTRKWSQNCPFGTPSTRSQLAQAWRNETINLAVISNTLACLVTSLCRKKRLTSKACRSILMARTPGIHSRRHQNENHCRIHLHLCPCQTNDHLGVHRPLMHFTTQTPTHKAVECWISGNHGNPTSHTTACLLNEKLTVPKTSENLGKSPLPPFKKPLRRPVVAFKDSGAGHPIGAVLTFLRRTWHNISGTSEAHNPRGRASQTTERFLCWVGTASGPFLANNFHPLKLGKKWVFAKRI